VVYIYMESLRSFAGRLRSGRKPKPETRVPATQSF
jgi:hypothetical protein